MAQECIRFSYGNLYALCIAKRFTVCEYATHEKKIYPILAEFALCVECSECAILVYLPIEIVCF